ncbi:MAG: hypothetical protein KDC54_13845 [Lewinella sp.]|nr:hypothetical protein [Lewinella sp.]
MLTRRYRPERYRYGEFAVTAAQERGDTLQRDQQLARLARLWQQAGRFQPGDTLRVVMESL